MKKNIIYITFILLASVIFNSCSDDDGTFDNKLFNTNARMSTTFLKPGVVVSEQFIEAKIAKKEDYDITIKYGVSEGLVATYNTAYYDKAIMLPESNYNIESPTVVMVAGTVTSTKLSVKFSDLDKLDKEQVYVLPVTILEANIAVLNSTRTTYYVFKGASLINVVADMEKNFLKPAGKNQTWNAPSVLSNLSELTLEALVNVRSFEKNNAVTSVMGIEGKFLIRIGDLPIKRNQIQVATSSGNHNGLASGLPDNQWVHIAVTYKSRGKVVIYINGEQHGGEGSAGSAVTFTDGTDGFYIGRSYDNTRYIEGSISECRIWNVVRSKDDIVASAYGVAADSPGLVAYWKCDEGEGNIVKDHTSNGNDLISDATIKWNPVKLP